VGRREGGREGGRDGGREGLLMRGGATRRPSHSFRGLENTGRGTAWEGGGEGGREGGMCQFRL